MTEEPTTSGDDRGDGDEGVESGMKGHGSISYLHIPAVDADRSAEFYAAVLGWRVRTGGGGSRAGFEDGSGHLGGAFVTNQAISREPGLLPYIYVDRIDETIERVLAGGGEVVTEPYPEGNLWVATFRDPAGNVMGLWQEGPREVAVH